MPSPNAPTKKENAMNPTHSAIPWKVVENSIVDKNRIFIVNLVGQLDDSEEANAAFIVRAVNAHEELLKLLNYVYENCEWEFGDDTPKRIRQAIARASRA